MKSSVKAVCKLPFGKFIQGVIYEGIIHSDGSIVLVHERGLDESITISDFDKFFVEI